MIAHKWDFPTAMVEYASGSELLRDEEIVGDFGTGSGRTLEVFDEMPQRKPSPPESANMAGISPMF